MCKAGRRLEMLVGIFLLLAIIMGIQANASEEIPENSLWQISQDVEVKEQASEFSKGVGNLEKGTPVIVINQAEEGWYKIQYQKIVGYVQKSFLENYNMGQTEALEQEFLQMREENIQFEDEYELMQEEKKSTGVWKAMIIVLGVAIFGVGIYSAITRNKENDSD